MVNIPDPITTINFALSVAILILGIAAYSKKKNKTALYIGVAFGCFGLSHLLTLLGMARELTDFLIVIRTLAYLTVAYAIFKLWKS